jgi:hypothetical protein
MRPKLAKNGENQRTTPIGGAKASFPTQNPGNITI